jgi:hypothetical protein
VSTSLRRPALRGALLLLTAILVAGLATVAARPAAAADNPSSVFGADVRDYHVDQLMVENAPGSDKSYAKDAGLNWVRAGVGWAWAQPAKQGAWDTAYMDKAKASVKKLTDRGFTPIVILQAAPDWVNGGAHKPCWVPDEHFGTFAAYAADVVRDFKASGIPVSYWQIWNEPEASIENFGGNMDQGIGCFGAKGDTRTYGGERYARFMQQAYKAIKEADPEAKVISGGSELGCHDCPQSKFWHSALGYDADRDGDPDGTEFFDIFDYHAYAGWAPGSLQDWSFIQEFNPYSSGKGYVFDKLRYVRKLLEQYGGAGKPVILGEAGLNCNVSSTGAKPCGDAGLDAGFTAAQASTVIRTYTRGLAAGLLAVEWFSFGDGMYFESELVDVTDGKVVRARPGYGSFKFLASQLGGARLLNEETCNLDPGQELCQPGASSVRDKSQPYKGYQSEAYSFCKGTTVIGVVWSNDFTKPVVSKPLDAGATVYDMYGNAKAGATAFEVGPDPNIVTHPNRPECGYQPPPETTAATTTTTTTTTAPPAPAAAPEVTAAPATTAAPTTTTTTTRAPKREKPAKGKPGAPFAVVNQAEQAKDDGAGTTDRTDEVAATAGGSDGGGTPGAGGEGDLPFTGAGTAIPAALGGLVLLLLGVTMLVAGRRRAGKR